MHKSTLILAGLVLGACTSERSPSPHDTLKTPPPEQKPPPTPTGSSEHRALSESDRAFAEKAAASTLFEMEASRVALDKDTSPEIRDIANKMIADHGQANRALQSILQIKGGSTTPAGLDADQQKVLEELQALQGPQFEAKYRSLQIEAHDESIRLFEAAARDCKDPDLRSFAETTLPTLRKHRSHFDG